MNRRVFLSACAVSAAGAAAWVRYIEPSWFEVTYTRVSVPGIRPKRILHVSDMHVSDGMTAPQLETGLAAGLAQRPDLFCFPGDFVSPPSGFDRPGLQRLLRRAADPPPPSAALENHEGGAWIGRHGGRKSSEP